MQRAKAELKTGIFVRTDADPALWKIADSYIGLAQFIPYGRMQSFYQSPFIDLWADYWTYLMIETL